MEVVTYVLWDSDSPLAYRDIERALLRYSVPYMLPNFETLLYHYIKRDVASPSTFIHRDEKFCNFSTSNTIFITISPIILTSGGSTMVIK